MAMSSSSTWGMTSRKPPKCAPMKKSALTVVIAPMALRLQKGDQPADVGVIASVLHDGEDPAMRSAASTNCRASAMLAASGFHPGRGSRAPGRPV